MVLCFREHFKCSLERQGSSRFCWRISLQHHPRAWVLLLCISFENDPGITVCWPRQTSREKRASGLMSHGKMDKEERESWDVTMACTLRVSEKNLNGACAKAMAACSALPLLLGKDVWFLHLLPEPEAAALLQPSLYRVPACSLLSRSQSRHQCP